MLRQSTIDVKMWKSAWSVDQKQKVKKKTNLKGNAYP